MSIKRGYEKCICVLFMKLQSDSIPASELDIIDIYLQGHTNIFKQ